MGMWRFSSCSFLNFSWTTITVLTRDACQEIEYVLIFFQFDLTVLYSPSRLFFSFTFFWNGWCRWGSIFGSRFHYWPQRYNLVLNAYLLFFNIVLFCMYSGLSSTSWMPGAVKMSLETPVCVQNVFWRGVVEELLWFISGSTNAKVPCSLFCLAHNKFLQVGMQEQPFQCILCFFLAFTDDYKNIYTWSARFYKRKAYIFGMAMLHDPILIGACFFSVLFQIPAV